MMEAALARHPAPARVEAHEGSAACDPHAAPFGGARAQDGVRTTAPGRARIDHDPAGRADAERPRVPSAGEPQAPRALCDRPDGERDREVERRAATAEACQATRRGSRRASFAHARERPASRHLGRGPRRRPSHPREPARDRPRGRSPRGRSASPAGARPVAPRWPMSPRARRGHLLRSATVRAVASPPERADRRTPGPARRNRRPFSRCPARSAAQKATSPGPREPTRPRARASATVAAAPSAAPRSPRRVAEASVRVEGESALTPRRCRLFHPGSPRVRRGAVTLPG